MQQLHLDRAQILYSQRRFDLAIEALNEHLRAAPEDYRGHALMSLCLERRGMLDAAEISARNAVRYGSDAAHPHYVLAFVLRTLNKYAEAEKSINEAVRIEPENVGYIALRANLFHIKGRLVDSLSIINEALALDPVHADLLRQKMYVLSDLGDERAAGEAMREALLANVEDSDIHATKGWSEMQTNRLSTATEDFREALRLNPSDDAARRGLVKSLYRKFWFYRVMDDIGLTNSKIVILFASLISFLFYMAIKTSEELSVVMITRLLIWITIVLVLSFVVKEVLVFICSRNLKDKYLYTKMDLFYSKSAVYIALPLAITSLYGAIFQYNGILYLSLGMGFVLSCLVSSLFPRKSFSLWIRMLSSFLIGVMGILILIFGIVVVPPMIYTTTVVLFLMGGFLSTCILLLQAD